MHYVRPLQSPAANPPQEENNILRQTAQTVFATPSPHAPGVCGVRDSSAHGSATDPGSHAGGLRGRAGLCRAPRQRGRWRSSLAGDRVRTHSRSQLRSSHRSFESCQASCWRPGRLCQLLPGNRLPADGTAGRSNRHLQRLRQDLSGFAPDPRCPRRLRQCAGGRRPGQGKPRSYWKEIVNRCAPISNWPSAAPTRPPTSPQKP